MDRDAFEHVVAAAANVSGEDVFVVVGSQAILGSHPDAPEDMLRSQELDLFPRERPEKAIEIEGSLGDGSAFAETFGYFVHGVGPETAKPPVGWEDRLVHVHVPPRSKSDRQPLAQCLEPHDLVLAKCMRGDQRDWDFTEVALRTGIVQTDILMARVHDLPTNRERKRLISTRIRSLTDGDI